LTRSELIAEIAAANAQLRGEDVEIIVATIFDGIISALVRGHRVELRGFGTFTARQRDPHTGRNPRTGEPVSVPAKLVPFFKAGRDLRQRVDVGKAANADRQRG